MLQGVERSFDNSSKVRSGQMKIPPLAFVDVETTGLDPRVNRITEIGVVTVNGGRVRDWSTVVNPLTRRQDRPVAPHEMTDAMRDEAPRFKDIASDLAQRLDGRLLVAHNARFDHGFLNAEFDRVGIAFAPRVLCSLMLSRRLYAEDASHNLDSLMASHELTAPVRHRALYDAKLIWQFWRHVHRTLPRATVANAIRALLESPPLPGHIDATWRLSQSPLGVRLRSALSREQSLPALKARPERVTHSWRFTPDATPCLALVPLRSRSLTEGDELYGIFDSPRKAKNAIRRLAAAHRLCHSVLGLDEDSCAACSGGHGDGGTVGCARGTARLGHLTRAFTALRDLRVPRWPYCGPIAVRERGDVYIFDQWRYLGTARSLADVQAAMETRAPEFNVKVFRLIVKTLRRTPASRVVPVQRVFPACAVLPSS